MSHGRHSRRILLLRGLAVLALATAARGGEIAGFYAESTHTLASKRIGTMTRKHKMWLTKDRVRFDYEATKPPELLARHYGEAGKPVPGCDGLTVTMDFVSGDVLIANRELGTFTRATVRHLSSGLADLGDVMVRHVATRVLRSTQTKEIGGKACRRCTVELAETPCTVWVEEDSRELFEALRGMARESSRQIGSHRAALVLVFGSLGGLPREVSIGDPDRLALTWTMDHYSTDPIPASTFDLSASCRQDSQVRPMSYTLLEHVYLVGEATAAWFSTSPDQPTRSLMPRNLDITTKATLEDFYKGRAGSERYGILRWGKPLVFLLAPDLWRYPLSGSSIDLLMVISTCFHWGGPTHYPALEMVKLPAN